MSLEADPEHVVSREARLAAAVECAPTGLLMSDAAGTILLANREIERLFGYARDELLGQPVEVLIPEALRSAHPRLRQSFVDSPRARAMGAGRDLFGRRKDGSQVPIEIGLTPVHTDEGLFVISSIVDISARRLAEAERRLLEEQLRQAQKMEALGRLAGGIAHDFNNLLGAIVGLAELALENPKTASADLEELLRAADRGRALVDQILRFGRREHLEKRPVSLADVIEESLTLLRASLPAQVEIHKEIEESLPVVLADPNAVAQVIMNLATNGARAMPAGGRLVLAASRHYVRDNIARSHPHLCEGEHVLLRVSDSGVGMDPETKACAFEPFFTTRPAGSGSGLGLSIVHALLRDHGGAVWIDSEPGEGTIVSCLFPIADLEGLIEAPETPGQGRRPGRGERVLCVDDEGTLGAIVKRRLENLGYAVTLYADPLAALAHVRSDPGAFDLVLTDLAMPQLGGLELAQAIAAIRPDLPIVLTSGWVEDLGPEHLTKAGITAVLRKPATIGELAATLSSALESP